jgi:hypothetical protein
MIVLFDYFVVVVFNLVGTVGVDMNRFGTNIEVV